MTQRSLLLTILVFSTFLSQAQQYDWGKQWGSIGNERSRALDVDPSGNVYMTAHFRGDMDLDPGTGTQTATIGGTMDLIVAKLDSTGNLLWAKQITGSDSEDPFDLIVDQSGNVFVTGGFQNTVDFDPGPGIFSLTATGIFSCFVLKLDPQGNFVWAKSIGGNGHVAGYGISTDSFGQVYLTGAFNATVDFDPGSAVHSITAFGFQDIFVLKLDSNGDFVWAKQMGGPNDDTGWGIQFTSLNEVLVSGNFSGTADLDPGPSIFSFVSNGMQDMFWAKLDSNGGFISAAGWGGPEIDFCFQARCDAVGNIYAGGYFKDTVDFDPGSGMAIYAAAGDADGFLSKFDAAGSWQWTNRIASPNRDWGLDLTLDDWGNPYLGGSFQGLVDFDPGPSNHILDGLQGSSFLVQYLPNGEFGWAVQMDGNAYAEVVGIAIGSGSEVHLLGDFFSDCDLDPGPGTSSFSSLGSRDIFLSKLSQCNAPIDTSVSVSSQTLMANLSNASYQWLDCNNAFAPVSGATSQSFSPNSSGNFAVSLLQGACADTSACFSMTVIGIESPFDFPISISPNPTSETLILQIPPVDQHPILTIHTATGRMVLQKELNELKTEIDLPGPQGMYILKVESESGHRATAKVLKL